MNLSHPTTITFLIYMVAMIGIGFAAWRRTRNVSDYILGGRRLGSLVTALSAGASDMSGWLLMGLPGALYGAGLSESWIALGLILGAWFNWWLVAGRLRVYTELTRNALTLGYLGQPHILARFMSAASIKVIPNARRIGMAWMILCLLGAMTMGFLGVAYFSAHPEQAAPVRANRETVFITLSQVLFNPWIAGILLAAILAAVMSTLSCQLLVCSSALTEDFYKSFFRPKASQRELVWIGRAMVLLVSAIAIVIAFNPDSRVLGLVGYAWAGFGSAFGPVVLFSVIWPRMTRNGALAGMLAGALIVILWHNGGWWGLYEMVPGFGLASLAIVVFSLLDRAPAETVTDTFARMRQQCRSRS